MSKRYQGSWVDPLLSGRQALKYNASMVYAKAWTDKTTFKLISFLMSSELEIISYPLQSGVQGKTWKRIFQIQIVFPENPNGKPKLMTAMIVQAVKKQENPTVMVEEAWRYIHWNVTLDHWGGLNECENDIPDVSMRTERILMPSLPVMSSPTGQMNI